MYRTAAKRLLLAAGGNRSFRIRYPPFRSFSSSADSQSFANQTPNQQQHHHHHPPQIPNSSDSDSPPSSSSSSSSSSSASPAGEEARHRHGQTRPRPEYEDEQARVLRASLFHVVRTFLSFLFSAILFSPNFTWFYTSFDGSDFGKLWRLDLIGSVEVGVERSCVDRRCQRRWCLSGYSWIISQERSRSCGGKYYMHVYICWSSLYFGCLSINESHFSFISVMLMFCLPTDGNNISLTVIISNLNSDY